MNEYESNSTEVTSTASSTPRRKWLRSKKSRWVASALVVAGLFGVTVGVAASNSGTPPASSAPGTPYKAGLGAGNGTSNARTAPAAGGTVGTIDTVSPSSFTLTTSTGQEVTVDDASTTMYGSGTGFHHRVIVLDRAGDPMMSARKMNEEAAQESSQRSLPKSIHPRAFTIRSDATSG
jgi:hypothetical protein